jgi:hypothetical protein
MSSREGKFNSLGDVASLRDKINSFDPVQHVEGGNNAAQGGGKF